VTAWQTPGGPLTRKTRGSGELGEEIRLTYQYTDPSGGKVEQVVTWEIEQGYQGRWSACKTFTERDGALEWIEKRRRNCPMENLRMIRVETTTVRTIESTELEAPS